MTFGSLFAGIGGLDLGFERAGHQCVWQVEIDPFCREVLAKRFPGVQQFEDITKTPTQALATVDCIVGGFPCQDLSLAGNRKGMSGSRSGLWFEFARVIGDLRPRNVVIENVPGLLVRDRREPHAGMSFVVGELARLGYVGCWRSLRAAEFGASHIRKRVFIIAQLANRDGELHEGSGDPRGQESARQPRRGEHSSGGGALGDSPSSRLSGGQSGQSRKVWDETRRAESGGRCDALSHSHGEGLSDSELSIVRGQGRRDEGRDAEQLRGAHMADSDGIGRGFSRQPSQNARGAIVSLGCSEDLPAFAYGPVDPRWSGLLRLYPDLAPSLPKPKAVKS